MNFFVGKLVVYLMEPLFENPKLWSVHVWEDNNVGCPLLKMLTILESKCVDLNKGCWATSVPNPDGHVNCVKTQMKSCLRNFHFDTPKLYFNDILKPFLKFKMRLCQCCVVSFYMINIDNNPFQTVLCRLLLLLPW